MFKIMHDYLFFRLMFWGNLSVEVQQVHEQEVFYLGFSFWNKPKPNALFKVKILFCTRRDGWVKRSRERVRKSGGGGYIRAKMFKSWATQRPAQTAWRATARTCKVKRSPHGGWWKAVECMDMCSSMLLINLLDKNQSLSLGKKNVVFFWFCFLISELFPNHALKLNTVLL